jgi:hypothetical protein
MTEAPASPVALETAFQAIRRASSHSFEALYKCLTELESSVTTTLSNASNCPYSTYQMLGHLASLRQLREAMSECDARIDEYNRRVSNKQKGVY